MGGAVSSTKHPKVTDIFPYSILRSSLIGYTTAQLILRLPAFNGNFSRALNLSSNGYVAMKSSRSSPEQYIALMLIGMGLFAIAAAVYALTQRFSAASATAENAAPEFSAVPEAANYAAPELTLTDLDGKTVSLQDYRGSVVLVNLWATWCPPCRAEMPTLEAFHRKYKDDGLVLIGINQEESAELVIPFVREFDLSFSIWLDLNYLAEKKFGTEALPSSFVIDRDGRVRLKWIGGISAKNLEKYVPDIIYGN